MKQIVSIIMATFNGEKFIRMQLDSILSQSYSNFELVVIDDASSDQTANIIAEFATKDLRVKFYQNQQNLGVVKSFERGLQLAKGSLIVLSDQDDIFLKNKLETLVNRIITEPLTDMVISDAKLINQYGEVIADSLWDYQNIKPISGKHFDLILYDNYATGCTLIFKKRLLKKALPFPKDIHMHDWWLAIVASSNEYDGIAVLNDRLTLYRQHQNNVFGAQQVNSGFISIFKRIFNRPENVIIDKKLIYLKHIKRLKSYLTLSCWSIYERTIILKTLRLYEGLQSDFNDHLIKRVVKIPFRIIFFLKHSKIREVFRVILLTLFPKI